MSEQPAFVRLRDSAIEIAVRLTPKSSRDHAGGVFLAGDGRAFLSVKVRAVPENGAANAALERVIADAVSVPKSAVSVVAGHTSRQKTVRVEADPANVLARLRRLAEDA